MCANSECYSTWAGPNKMRVLIVLIVGICISQFTVNADECMSKWIKVFENGPTGEVIDGNKDRLVKAAASGAAVKVAMNSNYVTTIQNVSPVKGELCAQAVLQISKKNYNTFQDNAYWWFVNMCTSGHVHMARYYVGGGTAIKDTKTRYNLQWFIRQGCSNKDPVLQITKDGTVIAGSVTNIVNAIKTGSSVRISDSSSGYTFPANNLQHNSDESEAAAQSLWQVSQGLSTDGQYMLFQDNSYWWFTIWSTSGKRDMSRWTVGEHKPRGHTHDQTAMKWYVDSCWKLAYSHDANGNQLKGSLSDLVKAVENGHKVKMVYDGESIEASFVQVRNGHVNGQFLNSVSKKSLSEFKENAYWYWRVASTSGSVKTVRYLVGTDTYVPGSTSSNTTISWFIDDRSWKNVLTVSKSGSIISGSKQVLEYAIRNGADVRYKLQFSGLGKGDASVIDADNLAINSDGSIGAMNVRSVSVSTDGANELKFQPNPYWWFTITDTNCRVDMSRWTVGKHKDRGHTNDKAAVVWFVSE